MFMCVCACVLMVHMRMAHGSVMNTTKNIPFISVQRLTDADEAASAPLYACERSHIYT